MCFTEFKMSESTAAALEKLSVAQLKDELTKYGLDTKGKKAVLVERLLEHQSSDLTGNNLSLADIIFNPCAAKVIYIYIYMYTFSS